MSEIKKKLKNNEVALYDFDIFFSNLFKFKYWIIVLSFILTFIIVITGLLKTPMYQASATILIGQYFKPQITCSDFNISPMSCTADILPSKAIMSEILTERKMNLFALKNIDNEIIIINNENETLKILSNAPSIEQAETGIKKLINFITELHLDRVEEIIDQNSSLIKTMKNRAIDIVDFIQTPINKKILNGEKVIEENISFQKKYIALHDEKIRKIDTQIEQTMRELNIKVKDKINTTTNQIAEINNIDLPQILQEIQLITEQSLLYNSLLNTSSLNEISPSIMVDEKTFQLANERLNQILYLKKATIKNDSVLLVANSKRLKLLAKLSGLNKTLNSLLSYEDQYDNTDLLTFPEQVVLMKTPTETYWQPTRDFLLKEKNNLDYLLAEKNDMMMKLNNVKINLSGLINEKYSFVNYQIPKFKIELIKIKNEISVREKQIAVHQSLRKPTNTALIQKIISPQRPHSPDLLLYLIFGFLSSLSLFLFIFSLLPLYMSSNKNVKIDS
jgi:hypothetical protein